MCTAATYKTKDFYFGRTLDYEFSYGEEVVVTPRRFCFELADGGVMSDHYAMIGMANVADGYPLYYDAVNEKGLCIAGLNFVGNAVYSAPISGRENIAQYELIPVIMGRCDSVEQARAEIKNMNITSVPFGEKYPCAQLHWIIADRNGCIAVEARHDGLHIFDNPVGVLTNNPPFEQQMARLCDFASLSPRQPENTFAPGTKLPPYSRGMGAMGLPGDLSSASRFARVAFTRAHSVSGEGEEESVSQFFHILGSVEQQRGCCELENGEYEITIYTSCCNADRGIYYYTTYDNRQITAVDMNKAGIDAEGLSRYPLVTSGEIRRQN